MPPPPFNIQSSFLALRKGALLFKGIPFLYVSLCIALFGYSPLLRAQSTLSGLIYTSGQTNHCYTDEVFLSPLSPDSFQVSGTAEVSVFSRNGIELRPGFSAKGFSTGGFFSAKISGDCSASTVSWIGTVSSDWNVAGNWSPAGVPGEMDTVLFTSSFTHQPLLDHDRTVAKIRVATGYAIDLGGHTLNAGSAIDLDYCEIKNGNLTGGQVDVDIYETTLNCSVDVQSRRIDVDNSVFRKPTFISKNGGDGTADQSSGNIFEDTTEINATPGSIDDFIWGYLAPDTFLSSLNIVNDSKFRIQMSQRSGGNFYGGHVNVLCQGDSSFSKVYFNAHSSGISTSRFRDTLTLSSNGGGGFELSPNGSAVMDSSGTLVIGEAGYFGSTLNLNKFTKYGDSPILLTRIDATTSVLIKNSDIDGDILSLDSASIDLQSSILRKDVRILRADNFHLNTHHGVAQLTFDASEITGEKTYGNVFHDSLYVTNASATIGVYMGHGSLPDTCYGPVILRNQGYRIITGSNTLGNFFGSDIHVINESTNNGNYVMFGNSASSSSYVSGDMYVSSQGGAIYLPYHGALQIGNGSTLIVKQEGIHGNTGLWLYGLEFLGSGPPIVLDSIGTTVDVQFTNSVVRRTVVSNIAAGKFRSNNSEFFEPLQVVSGRFYTINSTFHQDVHLLKTGGIVDFNGGNHFYQNLSVELDSLANGDISFGYGEPDTVLGDVNLTNTSSSRRIRFGHTAPAVVGGDLRVYPNNWEIYVGLYTGEGSLALIGEGDQVFEYQKGSPSYYNTVSRLLINKPSGSVLLEGEIEIGDTLWLTSGGIESALANSFDLLDDLVVIGGNDSSFIDGPVKKIGNDAFTFPLGDKGIYKPVTMTAPATTSDAIEVRYERRNPSRQIGDGFGEGSLSYLTPIDYWKLSQVAGTSNVTWAIGWDTLDSYSNFVTSDLRVAGWDGTEWDDLGAASLTGDTVSGLVSTTAAVELDSIKYLALGSINSSMLPKGIDANITTLVLPSDSTYGIVTIEPTFGIGEYHIVLNRDAHATLDTIMAYWSNSGIVDSIYSLFGDSISLTDTIVDIWSGQLQNWLEPGLYDVRLVDSSGDTVRKEMAFASSLLFGELDGLTYLNDTLVYDTAMVSWGSGSLAHRLDALDNGAVDFTLFNNTALFGLGFRDTSVVDTGGYESMDFAVVIDDADIHVWLDGELYEDVGTASVSDIFRVDRLSGEYRLLRNDLIVFRSGTHGVSSSKVIYPVMTVSRGKTPFGGILVYIHTPRPKFTVEHAVCGNPNSGKIIVNLGSIHHWPGLNVTWGRLDGDDPDYGSTQLTLSPLEAGIYTFSFSYNSSGSPVSFGPWTFYVDNWVDWDNLVEAVNSPNDASLISANSFSPSIFNGFSSESGANSEQELSGSSSGRVSFKLTSAALLNAIGITDSDQAPESSIGSIDYGLLTLFSLPPLYNAQLHVFIDNGSLATLGSWLTVTPLNSELHVEWDGTADEVRFSRGNNYGALQEFYSIGVPTPPSSWRIDANVFTGLTGYVNAHTNFICRTISYNENSPCALLRKTLDGGYHWTLDGKLRFQFDEEYVDGDDLTIELSYRVLNMSNEEVLGSVSGPSPISDDGLKHYGDNRFQLNLSSLIVSGMYILEVTSEKNEKFYLRFRKGV